VVCMSEKNTFLCATLEYIVGDTMLSGLLLTMIISWLIAFFGVLQFWLYIKNQDYKLHSSVSQSFSLLWLSIGGILFFTGLNHLCVWLVWTDGAYAMLYIAQTILGLTLVLGCWHLMGRLFHSLRALSFVMWVYAIAALAFWFMLFRFGFESMQVTYFSVQAALNHPARIIYTVMFAPLFGIVLYGLVRSLRTFALRQSLEDPRLRFELLSGLSLLVLALAGTMDELSLTYDWATAIARLCTLVGAMLAYFAIAGLRVPTEELVV